MRVMLATICLNEMEHLHKLFAQHRDWPGLVGWCFVEGADPAYRDANPELVNGWLSTDGTTDYLAGLAVDGGTVWHHKIGGWGPDASLDQAKCRLRNIYLLTAEQLKPDIIVQLDADEFYTHLDQQRINDICAGTMNYTAWMFKQRHIWRPESICKTCDGTGSVLSPIPQCAPPRNYHHDCPDCDGEDYGYYPLFSQEVVGGYWSVPHTRVWRYVPGMRHVRNHNWPESQGQYLTSNMMRCDLMDQARMPQCIHMGYASSLKNRAAKHRYYKARGEGGEGGRLGKKRAMYTDCRAAYEIWKPGDTLPHGAQVIPYTGAVPECFR